MMSVATSSAVRLIPSDFVVPVLTPWVMAVCTYSGHIEITRMPCGPHSTSSASVMARTKNLVALYTASSAWP